MNRFTVLLWSSVLTVTAALPCWAESGDTSNQVRKKVDKAVEVRQATQKDEERWRQEKEKLLVVYEQLRSEQEQLRVHNDRLEQETAAARERVAAKEKQLADIEQISADIDPFLRELVERLRLQIAEDMPFLTAERELRIHKLDDLMDDPEAPGQRKVPQNHGGVAD